MIFKNSQQTLDFSKGISLTAKRVGIKLSGGADSAIVCYMLANHVISDRPDITIHAITGIAEGKGYQKIFAENVMSKISELTGIKFGTHYYDFVRTDTSEHYVADQSALVNSLYEKKLIDMHLAGITANPTVDEAPTLYENISVMPSDDRSKTTEFRELVQGGSFRPLLNIDKKGVAELYTTLGVLEELFPVTRSCEEFTNDFSTHCGECWFCQEREWGFGRLI